MTSIEFEILVSRLRPRLIFFAKGFVGEGAATSEDMVQDATIKLWNSGQIQEIKNPEVLLRHILRNVCLDYIKLKKNSMERLSSDYIRYATDSPSTDIERKEKISLIHRLIKELPEEQVMAVRLRDVMGYEMEEIAMILSTTEGNVRTLLSRARRKLREQLTGALG
jgi:RNA polymerase sigma factor, sigma-70 family